MPSGRNCTTFSIAGCMELPASMILPALTPSCTSGMSKYCTSHTPVTDCMAPSSFITPACTDEYTSTDCNGVRTTVPVMPCGTSPSCGTSKYVCNTAPGRHGFFTVTKVYPA